VTPVEALLWPFSVVYGVAARLRVWLYNAGVFNRYKLNGAVISVGNLTVGGTGKTPMVLLLAERFAAKGTRVAVLTRGYRGFLKGSGASKFASDDGVSIQGMGDEPELLRRRMAAHAYDSRQFRVFVGANRAANGRAAEREGFDCFLLDDGFQHLKLARDLDVVLIDAGDPFGGGGLLPSGRLREPKSALRRADILVITRSTHAPAIEGALRRYSGAPIFYAVLQLDAIERADETGGVVPEEEWKSRSYLAYCGIGNPNSFFENLRDWRVNVVGTAKFPDHHLYSMAERTRIESEAKSRGADALICTEKDICNFGSAWTGALPVHYARITLQPQNAEEFWALVQRILSQRRPGIAS
jgi:tetraacyldisaccharide 4'-kinase